LFFASIAFEASAQTSFLDTDFFCQNFGCVVIHDGQDFDIYDNFRFASNSCCIPFGAQMISFFTRAGETNQTGTTQRAVNFRPDPNQSFRLGILQAANGNPTLSTFDDGDGFLDAGDTLSRFSISTNTDVGLDSDERSYSHSIFISSRNTRFSVRAQAEIDNVTGDFEQTLGLDDIAVDVGVTRRGNDDGFDFGARGSTANSTFSSTVNTLDDLTSGQIEIAEFRRFAGIRTRTGSINQQLIRLDLEYTMPDYDLSMGLGSLDATVTIDFFREP
jgi:hypothetical protein